MASNVRALERFQHSLVEGPQTAAAGSSITCLPSETCGKIAEYLDFRDLQAFARASWPFREIAMEERITRAQGGYEAGFIRNPVAQNRISSNTATNPRSL